MEQIKKVQKIKQKIKKIAAFTLLETMVVVALISILALIAIPSYERYAQKSRRAAALAVLQSMQLNQEKHRSNNNQYGTIAQVWNGVTSTDDGYYGLAITGQTATGYTLTATAQGSQASDKQGGVACSALSLVVNGASLTKNPAQCW